MTRGIVFWLAAAMASAQQLETLAPGQQPPPTTGTSSITGTVVNNATGEPVKKAMVTLGGPISGNQPAAVTDASGSFAFRKLPAGAYFVTAQREGFNQDRGMIIGDSQKQVTVEADQGKSVELRLWPNGSISGRLTDENGDAAQNCNITAVTAGAAGSQQMRGNASTDDRGEYRIADLPAGRYLVYQRCYQNLIAPHGFLERGDPSTPFWAWVPGYFGGSDNSSGAAPVSVAAGVEVRGIDFHLKIANTWPVRIQVIPDDPGIDVRNAMVRVLPRDAALGEMAQSMPARVSPSALHTVHVISGAYVAVVDAQDGDRRLHGEAPVDVGDGPPAPVRVQLSAGATISGDVVSDDNSANASPGSMGMAGLMALNPSHGNMFLPGQPAKDGGFTISNVEPGRYRLQVQGPPNTIKSVTLAGNAVSPEEIDIGPGAAGPLHVVISLKQAQLHVTVSDLKTDQVAWVIAVPKMFRPGNPFMNLPMMQAQKDGTMAPATPGAYSVYALECPQPWPLLNDPAFLTMLADRGKAVQVTDQGDNNVTVNLVTRDELRTALEQAGSAPQ